jgi:hypothetical protein
MSTRKIDGILRERGKRYPVTYKGMKTEWRRKVKTDLKLDLHFHDMRHTRATRTLKLTGNIKASWGIAPWGRQLRTMLTSRWTMSVMRSNATRNPDKSPDARRSPRLKPLL